MARFQSHGAVLLVGDDGVVRHVSHGCGALLGAPEGEIVGASFGSVLSGLSLDDLSRQDAAELLGPAWRIAALNSGAEVKVRCFAAAPGLTGVDVIALPKARSATEAVTVERIMRWTARLQEARDITALLRDACAIAVSLSGFEGAWAVRIEDDGSGVVESAAVSGGAPDTTGSSVTAANLPPDDLLVAGRPAPFYVADVTEPANDLTPPATGKLDLSGSALHRPFDEYLDFLASFGVRGAFSIPIVAASRTWARLIGHHPEPMVLRAAAQSELRLLGLTAGTRLQELLDEQQARERVTYAVSTAKIMASIASAAGGVQAGLADDPQALLELCAAQSAVIAINDAVTVVGDTLPAEVIDAVLADARRKLTAAPRPVAASSTMPFTQSGNAGGYLAMRLVDDPTDVIVWLRPERRRTVQWVTVQGSEPRTNERRAISDAITSTGRPESSSSDPWTPAQLEAVEAFRSELASVMMSRYSALSLVNVDLQRSNEEFDAFAHTVAHDLRQPIRGITQYTEFFLEDVADRLTPEEIEQLQTVLRLAGRGNELLGDLMRYAQLGEQTWTTTPQDLQTASSEAIEQLDPALTAQADIHIADGTITADPSALRQLLANLIGNALKYSDGPAHVNVSLTTLAGAAEVSTPPASTRSLRHDTTVLAVEDHGVGISADNATRVFGLFKRANDTLPGVAGTGAGLAMCMRIAQRHGGDIWLTSTPGQGTTIYAILTPANR